MLPSDLVGLEQVLRSLAHLQLMDVTAGWLPGTGNGHWSVENHAMPEKINP